jgi:ribonuclease HII
VACAVILPEGLCIAGADDSKRLTSTRRLELAAAIRASGASVGLGAASPREIDRLNILQATTLAMRRALAALPSPPDHVVVDGRPVRGLGVEHEAVVGGDGLIHCISCASIVAKVLRDDLMQRLAHRYPGYGWETNVGYGTKAHRDALEAQGPTPHHRRSFLGLQHRLEL